MHVLAENTHTALFVTAGVLLLKLVSAITALSLLFNIYFKNYKKAGIFTFLLLSFYLFFGSAHDFLKTSLVKQSSSIRAAGAEFQPC